MKPSTTRKIDRHLDRALLIVGAIVSGIFLALAMFEVEAADIVEPVYPAEAPFLPADQWHEEERSGWRLWCADPVGPIRRDQNGVIVKTPSMQCGGRRLYELAPEEPVRAPSDAQRRLRGA